MIFAVCLIINFGHITHVSRWEINKVLEKYTAEDEFALMLWNDTKEFKNANDICIKWWHSDNDGKYYIFVSESLLNQGLYWIFPTKDSVRINEENIENGSLCDIAEGAYTVVAEAGGKTKNYEIEIRYASDIATIFLNTQSGSMDSINGTKEYRESGNYTLFEKGGKFSSAGVIEDIHCRGNTSWYAVDKKSYQLDLKKASNLLGMGKASKWNLIANAVDNSLLRNVLTFDIANKIGLDYTPESAFVDIYANGEYIGNYILTEKIEISKNRININNLEKQTKQMNISLGGNYTEFSEAKGTLKNIKGYIVRNEPKNISGGYLLELELDIEMENRYDKEKSGFITSRNQPVVLKSPSMATYNQVNYIANMYQGLEDALFGDNGINPNTGMSYLDYIDIDSFSRKYLIEELTKNWDASFTSQFLYKPGDSISTRFFAGPVWDYDDALANWGSKAGFDGSDPNGLYAAVQTRNSDIWYALYNQSEFRKNVAEIFFSETINAVNEIVNNDIDNYVDNIAASVVNNAIRWNIYDVTNEEKIRKLYNADIDIIKNFLSGRIEFLSNEWNQYKIGFAVKSLEE